MKTFEGVNIFTYCCQVISGPVARNVEDVERVAGNVPCGETGKLGISIM